MRRLGERAQTPRSFTSDPSRFVFVGVGVITGVYVKTERLLAWICDRYGDPAARFLFARIGLRLMVGRAARLSAFADGDDFIELALYKDNCLQ